MAQMAKALLGAEERKVEMSLYTKDGKPAAQPRRSPPLGVLFLCVCVCVCECVRLNEHPTFTLR